MLYLTRKIGESVVINDEIEVTVVDIRGKSIKLGFTFPPEASVLRREIYDRIQSENKAAASASEAFAAVFTPDGDQKNPSIQKSDASQSESQDPVQSAQTAKPLSVDPVSPSTPSPSSTGDEQEKP
ncbi:carbon storage regulator CsrA [Rhodovibrionaceae bacterium A322]